MIRVMQAVTVNKVTCCHTQVSSVGVHHAGKGTFRTRNVLGHSYAGIITRLHNNTAQQIANLNGGAHFNEHLRGVREVLSPGIF